MPGPVRFQFVDNETVASGVAWFAYVRRIEGTVFGVMHAGPGAL